MIFTGVRGVRARAKYTLKVKIYDLVERLAEEIGLRSYFVDMFDRPEKPMEPLQLLGDGNSLFFKTRDSYLAPGNEKL